MTPRKCSLFGVNCEAIPRQVNFLCDESGNCGKGANAVISQLHYYFENHGLGDYKSTVTALSETGIIHKDYLSRIHKISICKRGTSQYSSIFDPCPYSIAVIQCSCYF